MFKFLANLILAGHKSLVYLLRFVINVLSIMQNIKVKEEKLSYIYEICNCINHFLYENG